MSKETKNFSNKIAQFYIYLSVKGTCLTPNGIEMDVLCPKMERRNVLRNYLHFIRKQRWGREYLKLKDLTLPLFGV